MNQCLAVTGKDYYYFISCLSQVAPVLNNLSQIVTICQMVTKSIVFCYYVVFIVSQWITNALLTFAIVINKLESLILIWTRSTMTKAHLQTRLNYGYSYLIFVAGTAGGARGKKICHVEKFQISAYDRRNLKFLHTRINFTFLHMTDVEKSEISPHVEWFQIYSHDRCGEIYNLLHYVYNLWHFVAFYTVFF